MPAVRRGLFPDVAEEGGHRHSRLSATLSDVNASAWNPLSPLPFGLRSKMPKSEMAKSW
jgi:hypothetical protein